MKRYLLAIACTIITYTAPAKDNSLLFIENVGQFTDQFGKPRPDIDVVLRSGGMHVFVGAGTIHYQFMKSELQVVGTVNPMAFAPNYSGISSPPQPIQIHRVDVELVGANKSVKPLKERRLQYYERYYTPQFEEDGGTAHAYSRIVYKDIYPHIDWVLYINREQVEYDFIVREGGNPADIRLRYSGVDSLSIDKKGDLTATASSGKVIEHAPKAWQEDGKQVAASFRVEHNTASFNVGAYKGTLLIDPYIEWATFYGGAGEEGGVATEDPSGNLFLGGTTNSASNIATIGSYDISYADSGDVFLVKFDSDGVRLWSTYYGGQALDHLHSIASDPNGNVFIFGSTNNATGIATNGSSQPNFSGPYNNDPSWGGDAFLVKFNSLGNRVWSTYFGGSEPDFPNGMDCDANGNIVVSGFTASYSNIATIGAHQTTFGGNSDAFLAKYDSAGTKLWSTFYGGGGQELVTRVAIAPNNKIYICGYTASSNNIATPGVFQDAMQGNYGSYIASFDENGIRLWGTYFHGASGGSTHLLSIFCNGLNDVFVAGMTTDSTGLTTNGCHQLSYGGGGLYNWGDGIVARFDNTGNRIWSTYFGGSGGDQIQYITQSPSGEIYICGATMSANNIAINAYQSVFGGSAITMDGWLAKLNAAGMCIWSTYLGGANNENISSVICSSGNYLYVSGGGSTLPTISGSHQPNFGGGTYDAYLAKFKDFPTGISTVSNKPGYFSVYPNPNSGTFVIEGALFDVDQSVSLTISNIVGQTVYSERFPNTERHLSKQITLSNSLPAGIYMLNIVSGNYSAVERIIKN